MNKVTFTVIGYILLLFGFLSLILGFIGLSFKPLGFLDELNPYVAFLFKLLVIILGFIVFYISRTYEEDMSK